MRSESDINAFADGRVGLGSEHEVIYFSVKILCLGIYTIFLKPYGMRDEFGNAHDSLLCT